MNKTMYLIFEDWANGCDKGQDFKLFNNYDKAKEYFNDCIITSKDFVDCENKIVENYDDLYEEYEEGYYSCNYYKIELKKMGVE